MNRVRAFAADWLLAGLLGRRCARCNDQWLIERKSDGSLWTAGHAQNLSYAMRSLFVGRCLDWHFYRVRIWRGVPIAARKVFWLPTSGGEFRLRQRLTIFELPPWPEPIECMKIDAARERHRHAA